MKKIKLVCLSILFLAFFLPANSQSVSNLISNYSGIATWDETSKTVTFETTGTIYFADKVGNGNNPQTDQMQNFWDVPTTVAKIIIKENVTLTGAFHTFATCAIEGENRYTSIVYGTDVQRWADANNPGGQDLSEWYYAQFQNYGGTLTIKNLTSLNSFSYHVRGWSGKVIHLDNCDFIDNRGGSGNHSDGFCGGDGSTVNNCYFETGDDIFKTYFDYTVTNCTVNMIENCVPIQMGWGDYSSGSKVDFYNLTITGTSGRWSPNKTYGVIVGRTGNYSITVNIDGLNLENPNAHLVMLWEENMTLNGAITNAKINVKAYTQAEYNKGTVNLTVCGSTEQSGQYDCISPGVPIPGKIEAEDYDKQNNTEEENCTDTDGGKNMKLSTDSYLDYNLIAESAGEYTLDLRMASVEDFNVEITTDNMPLAMVNSTTTGGDQQWQTFSTNIDLTQGAQTIRVYSNTDNTQLNWLDFKKNQVRYNITDLIARVKNSSKVDLFWNEIISDETGFIIERKKASDNYFSEIGTADANDTSFIDENLEAFTLYEYRVRTAYSDGNSQASAKIYARTMVEQHETLPAPWQTHVFGDTITSTASTAMYNAETEKIIIDAGEGDFWSEVDRAPFVYQSYTGDCEIITYLDDYTHSQSYAQAGVMMRETLDDGSKFAGMFFMSEPGPIVRDRVETDGTVNQLPYPQSGEKAPVWLRLTRVGNVFTGYWSFDGLQWTMTREVTIEMATDIYVGMAASSHTADAVATYSFSKMSVGTPKAEYTVTATASDGGSITPNGTLTVLEGTNLSFTIAVNSGYSRGDVTVDGTSVGAVETYEMNNISSNHTIAAKFDRITYTITASAGENGSISPIGEVVVGQGENQEFTITPNTGYQVDDVVVDGISKGAVTSFLFSSLMSNHSINATFKVGTSINSKDAEAIKVYPNPTSNILYLKNLDNTTSLELIGLDGKVHVNMVDITSETSLDLSTINNGVYILKIKSNNRIESIKIIKN